MRRRPVGLSFLVLAAVVAGLAPSAVSAEEETAPYVVVLGRDNDSAKVANEHAQANGFRAKAVYKAAIKGYAADLSATQLAKVKNDRRVAYVDNDVPVQPLAQTLPWGINRVDADISSTQAGNGSGAVGGVHIYIIDSGVPSPTSSSNVDLTNATNDANFVGGSATDCFGHGAHVAGIAAASDNASLVVGAAPGARLHAVKVFNCSGGGASVSTVISALDWVAANRVLPAVANLSLGASGIINSINDGVRNLANSKGVVVTVAAGNSGANACNFTPAAAGTTNGVITVGATRQSRDRVPSYSNYGQCVDLYAPGSSIQSLSMSGGGTATMTGTSMASPHVTGVAALYRSTHAGDSPATVESRLKADSQATGQTKGGYAVRIVQADNY